MRHRFAWWWGMAVLVAAGVDAQAIKIPPVRTVATLGACASGGEKLVIVTDGLTASDCTVGGGASRNLCMCNGTSWALGGGSGTVTSAALTVPSWLTVAGSPITTSGSFDISAATGQAANLVLGTCNGATSVSLCQLTDSQVPNNITVDLATAATTAASASDLSCTDCVALGTETSGGYAASVSEGGPATTATALAANGGNCSAGSFPLGVDASGAAETCTALPTSIAGTANQIAASAATGSVVLSIPTNPTLPGTTTGTFSGNVTGNVTGNASTATALAADPADCSAGQVATGIAASGALSCTATPTVTSITGILLGGGSDDADSGLVRGSNNVDLVCSEKATTGTDSCLKYTSSDTWTVGIAGTTRLTVSATSLNFTASANTDHELTLDGFAFGPGTQGSASGWTFYGSSSEDVIGTSGYIVQSGNIIGFDNGNPGSTTTKPQGQLKGGASKTLTDNSATAFVRLTMASGSTIGGRVTYSSATTDGTDFVSRSGIMVFSAVDKAGTITCTVSTVASDTEVVAATGGATLVNNGFSCADAGSNLLELRANFDSSFASPTDTFKWQMEAIGVQGTLLITPQ